MEALLILTFVIFGPLGGIAVLYEQNEIGLFCFAVMIFIWGFVTGHRYGYDKGWKESTRRWPIKSDNS